MTDPVSGQAASQAAEQIGTEAVDEIDGTDPSSDFSEMMNADQQPDPGADGAEQVGPSMEIDKPEPIDRVEKPGEIPTDDFIQSLLAEEANLHDMMENCLNGGDVGQQEMLQMQALVYSYSQRVDLTTKVVENATSGIKQVMNTQV